MVFTRFLRGQENQRKCKEFLLVPLIFYVFADPLENLVKYSVFEHLEASRNRPDRSGDVPRAILCLTSVFWGSSWEPFGASRGPFSITFLMFFHAFSHARFHRYLHGFGPFWLILAPFLVFFWTSLGSFLASFLGPWIWRFFSNWVNAWRSCRSSRWSSFSYDFF